MPDFYGTFAGYSTYCESRNHSHAAHAQEVVEAALLVASEWIDATYRSGFGGLKVDGRDQVREWPRTGALDTYGYAIASATVPTEIEYATYEAAHREIESQGSLSVDYTPPKYKRASVDGAVSVEYNMFNNARDAQTRIHVVDQILTPILTAFYPDTGYTGSAVRG